MKYESQDTFCAGSLVMALASAKTVIKQERSVDKDLAKMCVKLEKVQELGNFYGIATKSRKQLNTFCEKHSLPTVFKDVNDDTVALGYFKLQAKWLKSASKQTMTIKGNNYISAKTKQKDSKFHQYKSKQFKYVFNVPTKQGYSINLGALEGYEFEPDDLFRFSTRECPLQEVEQKFNVIEFPQCEIAQRNNLKFSTGESITENCIINGNKVAKSEQFNKLKLTHIGADVESLTKMRTKGIERVNMYQFTQPFVVWVTHPTTGNWPLFVAVANKKHWLKA